MRERRKPSQIVYDNGDQICFMPTPKLTPEDYRTREQKKKRQIGETAYQEFVHMKRLNRRRMRARN